MRFSEIRTQTAGHFMFRPEMLTTCPVLVCFSRTGTCIIHIRAPILSLFFIHFVSARGGIVSVDRQSMGAKKKEVYFIMKRKILSALLSCAMVAGLACTPALAAAPQAEVTEMTIGDNTVYVYAPESDMVVSSTCTAPCFILFGDEAYTAESAKVEAESSGLAQLAAQEGATVVLVNPQGESWADADTAVYAALIGMYSNSSTSTFVNGISNDVNAMTGQTETKILGDTGRVYLYGEGSGADFVAANFMKSVVMDTTYPDGVTISFDRTPTSVTLFNPTEIPAAASPADIAVAVVNGPENTEDNLAALTEKAVADTSAVTAGIDSQWVIDHYKTISGAYRRQAGFMIPVHDWAAEGIVETIESFTLADGSTVNYVTYYGNDLDVTDTSSAVPLVLIFHGGGNTALYEAQASEWPLIGKEYGFITVAVDLHYPNTTAAQTVELLDHLKSEYSIDASRVYASGFSMGSIKSWDLFEQYPTLFAGVAPMDGANNVGIDSYNQQVDYNTDVVMPVFYVGGQTSPLPELANQDAKIQERIAYAFSVNGVKQEYSYNEAVNPWWGVNGEINYGVTDQVYFTNSTLNVHLFQSTDGRYYTALADATNQSHEVYGRNSWAAWDFLSQFSRNADGSLTISEVTYSRPADDGSVVNNSYNTAPIPEEPDVPDVPDTPEEPEDPTPVPSTITHTVLQGECLWTIARDYLGSGTLWENIYNANRDTISNPNLIYVGQILNIPMAQ